MVELVFPPIARGRGPGYWLRPGNLWASRRKLRADYSTEWREAFTQSEPPPDHRSTSFEALLGRPIGNGFRFVILGDTGEGDRSQYGLLPLLRAVEPDFMIINGDVAYPAGRDDDFEEGFFGPYRSLDIPIWAVPGNHEYYSRHRGREFFEIFCTRKHAARWADHGLRLVPQPGTYWELRAPNREVPLVVLAVDSGMTANLDGHGRTAAPDFRQHQWLDWRLGLADARGDGAIVLFHIPALVRERHSDGTHLTALHRILAAHPCVRMVVCAHEHNHQEYRPDIFGKYVGEEHGAGAVAPAPPHYIVSGNGGAFVGHTDFKAGRYPTARRFPSPEQWREHANLGRRIVEHAGLSKTLLARMVGVFEKAALTDADAARMLSFLMVAAEPNQIRASPVLMDDLQHLFSHLPEGTRVHVQEPNPPADTQAVAACIQPAIVL
ncbi:MAG: metallophosphoesterase [Gemmatimonadetes bacterium]|nr:metallophosphoesterase [Gemmatimonadota bacterium]